MLISGGIIRVIIGFEIARVFREVNPLQLSVSTVTFSPVSISILLISRIRAVPIAVGTVPS